MSMTLNERNPNTDVIPVGSLASGTTTTLPGLFLRKHSRIKNVYYKDGAAIAASTTNWLDISLQDTTGTPVVYAKASTSGGALTAFTNYPLALQSTSVPGSDANHLEEDVPAGTELNPKIVSHGTAVTTNGVIVIEWYPL